MANIVRVTAHLQAVARARHPQDWRRRALRLLPTLAGDWFVRDEAGSGWRCYHFIEDSHVYRRVDRVDHARAAARAFGEFLTDLQDLPTGAIGASVPGLHDTPARLAALRAAAGRDELGRVAEVEPELAALLDREADAARLADAGLPLRVVHNDTKLNNVLFDRATDRPLCVVDLDTVMPGLALHDFGDLVRSAAASGLEDAASVDFRLEVFEALVAGYLDGAGAILTDGERALMAAAPRVITLELAARFLTDYLQGDRYFKTSRPGQNRDRCRAQLALLQDMERQEAQMQRVVGDLIRR
jgi:aminoglycoside phosphotransferase (APT) family kinase protein